MFRSMPAACTDPSSSAAVRSYRASAIESLSLLMSLGQETKSLGKKAQIQRLVGVDRRLEPLQLLVHEARHAPHALGVDPSVRIAVVLVELDIRLERRTHQARLVDLALRLLRVREVPAHDRGVVRD